MNELTTFQFDEGREVRTLERDGETWFVAKDVCDILGLGNPTEVLRNFPEDERNTLSSTEGEIAKDEHSNLSSTEVRNMDIPNRGVNIINEPGCYRLIFQSRKPEAETFKRWVFHEVLPAIRKKGFYAVPGLMERLENLIERQSGLLDDPKKAVYEELEQFVRRNLVVEEKRISVVSVHNLYREYEKDVEIPLDEREFMLKILLDHPEFELIYKKKAWLFTRCCMQYRHNR